LNFIEYKGKEKTKYHDCLAIEINKDKSLKQTQKTERIQ